MLSLTNSTGTKRNSKWQNTPPSQDSSLRRWPHGPGDKWKRWQTKRNPPGNVGTYEAVLVGDEDCWRMCGQCRCLLLPPATCWTTPVLVCCLPSRWCVGGVEKWSLSTNALWPSLRTGSSFVTLIGFSKFILKQFLIAKCSFSKLLLLEVQKIPPETTSDEVELLPWAKATRQNRVLCFHALT